MIATLQGKTVLFFSLTIPAQGVPWADVEVSSEEELTGKVVFAIGDVSYSMTVVSSGVFAGRARYRLAGGAGKWGQDIPAQDYCNDAGVKASTVVQDAARLCGETVDVSGLGDARLGPRFVRCAGMASASLPAPWYVDETGVTRFGARPAGEIQLTGSELSDRPDPSRGGWDLAPADSIAKFQPGKTIGGALVSDVHVNQKDGKIRVQVWARGKLEDPTLEAFRRIVDSLDPCRKFRGTYEYRVVSTTGNKLNLQIVRSSTGMPDLQRVTVRAGVAGAKQSVQMGSLVLVSFIDGDRTRPAITSFDDPDSPGFVPSSLELVGEDDLAATVLNPLGRVVRYGDVVALPVGPAPGIGAPPPAGEFQLLPTGVALVPGIYAASSVSRVRA